MKPSPFYPLKHDALVSSTEPNRKNRDDYIESKKDVKKYLDSHFSGNDRRRDCSPNKVSYERQLDSFIKNQMISTLSS